MGCKLPHMAISPFFFDIDFSQAKVQLMLQYMRDGFYIDEATSQLSIRMLTYNAMLDTYCYILVEWHFLNGGAISMENRISSIDLYKYGAGTSKSAYDNGRDSSNFVRMCLEILLWIAALYFLSVEVCEAYDLGIGKYLGTFWNWVDNIAIFALLTGQAFWLTNSFLVAAGYTHTTRWNVHPFPSATARMLQLNSSFVDVKDTFNLFERAIQNIDLYMTFNAIAQTMMLCQVLKSLHFQPRMGLVTRTFERAFVDLAHFLLLFIFILIGYAFVGHMTFGSEIFEFATPASAVETLVQILLGDLEVKYDLDRLTNRGTVIFFFWTFIVLMFFIMINVLLAIIVDAYMDVKESAEGSGTMLEEIWEVISADFIWISNICSWKTGGTRAVHPALIVRCCNQMVSLHAEQRATKRKIRIDSEANSELNVHSPNLMAGIQSSDTRASHIVRIGPHAHVNFDVLVSLFEYTEGIETGKEEANSNGDTLMRRMSDAATGVFKHTKNCCQGKRRGAITPMGNSSNEDPKLLRSTGSDNLANTILSLYKVRDEDNEQIADLKFKHKLVTGIHRLGKSLETVIQTQEQIAADSNLMRTQQQILFQQHKILTTLEVMMRAQQRFSGPPLSMSSMPTTKTDLDGAKTTHDSKLDSENPRLQRDHNLPIINPTDDILPPLSPKSARQFIDTDRTSGSARAIKSLIRMGTEPGTITIKL